MKRKFRLTRSNDIKRVRRAGKSYAHPLVVLVSENVAQESIRIAVITGRSIGGAVERNLVRRRIRSICDELIPRMRAGYLAVLIARSPSSRATFEELKSSVISVFQRAGLLQQSNE